MRRQAGSGHRRDLISVSTCRTSEWARRNLVTGAGVLAVFSSMTTGRRTGRSRSESRAGCALTRNADPTRPSGRCGRFRSDGTGRLSKLKDVDNAYPPGSITPGWRAMSTLCSMSGAPPGFYSTLDQVPQPNNTRPGERGTTDPTVGRAAVRCGILADVMSVWLEIRGAR